MLAVSCSDILDDAEYVDDIKLGAKEKFVECPSGYGECSFEVVSNCAYSARISEGAEWLSFTGKEGSEIELSGSTTLSLSYTSNRGYRRCGVLVLSSAERNDTLRVKQEGSYIQAISADIQQIDVPGEGGEYHVGIQTNLIKKDLKFETVDMKGFPIIDKVDRYDFSDNVFSFRILPSVSRDEKIFYVRIYTVDGWGEKISTDIKITQKPGRK